MAGARVTKRVRAKARVQFAEASNVGRLVVVDEQEEEAAAAAGGFFGSIPLLLEREREREKWKESRRDVASRGPSSRGLKAFSHRRLRPG